MSAEVRRQKIQAVVSCPLSAGYELRSPVRIANSLNLGVISPASWFVGSLLFYVFETSLAISGWLGTHTRPAFFFPPTVY